MVTPDPESQPIRSDEWAVPPELDAIRARAIVVELRALDVGSLIMSLGSDGKPPYNGLVRCLQANGMVTAWRQEAIHSYHCARQNYWEIREKRAAAIVRKMREPMDLTNDFLSGHQRYALAEDMLEADRRATWSGPGEPTPLSISEERWHGLMATWRAVQMDLRNLRPVLDAATREAKAMLGSHPRR